MNKYCGTTREELEKETARLTEVPSYPHVKLVYVLCMPTVLGGMPIASAETINDIMNIMDGHPDPGIKEYFISTIDIPMYKYLIHVVPQKEAYERTTEL